MSGLILSIHDVSPATFEETDWWVTHLEQLGIRATLLVIPGPWRGHSMSVGDPLARPLRRWEERGHEISLHGWEHVQQGRGRLLGQVLARGAGEFANLDGSSAGTRLAVGMELLAANDLTVTGFTPPGWLISSEARDSVARAGIGYFTTHRAIHDLGRARVLNVPVVCHRPGSRLSLLGTKVMRNGYRLSRWTGRTLRLAIHPDDTHDQCLSETTLSVLRSAVESGVRVLPYRTYLESP